MLSPTYLPFAAEVHPQARPAARLTWDSRQADPETAFVALPGEQMHGNAFVEQALERGAPFVLTDLNVPRAVRVTDARAALFTWATAERGHNPLVVGITGSVGKTTAKSYAAAALDAHFMPVFNTLPAIACFLLEFGRSGSPLVVEMGIDRPGEMRELVDLVRPDVGVITSIGAAHLEALGSVAGVAREKGVILEAARRLVSPQAAEWFADVDTYGFEGASFAGQHLTVNAEGASFTFGDVPVNLPHASRVQAEAAVLGLALAKQAGLDLTRAAERLSGVSVPGGRYRVLAGRFTVIDDTYNASPLSMKAALEALGTFGGRKISVLGQMLELGEDERAMHAEVGTLARQHADLTYGVGPFAELLGEWAFTSVPPLLDALRAEVRDGDVILVKASRGISWTPEKRLAEGVGLDSVVDALLELRADPVWTGKK
ncbi:UDP-N-acetylmuramoyl-tripeptide--D-alanyl-D-alanine ligase [Deinococcus psychrotolerans]|uniref:UDP-N-acetylmuramoyl-tripeptide--D-alanyl-D-alanine ligase n=1 Tax=Deinococcus psychrotolerans TaxID=2489213 RepID=A0A3G8Y8U7_9DEIO|nr:UDP-N-acetylmuramoyl-tripeptide--D-alanyl-D-alanine ligase [Deinococcus psychrotolerans]AZI41333.1 UDP-N-acetylmuramoyl-tripeptide--D-alanyl-D-alanine ligase [Deinococcus psychrotolerans]